MLWKMFAFIHITPAATANLIRTEWEMMLNKMSV